MVMNFYSHSPFGWYHRLINLFLVLIYSHLKKCQSRSNEYIEKSGGKHVCTLVT